MFEYNVIIQLPFDFHSSRIFNSNFKSKSPQIEQMNCFLTFMKWKRDMWQPKPLASSPCSLLARNRAVAGRRRDVFGLDVLDWTLESPSLFGRRTGGTTLTLGGPIFRLMSVVTTDSQYDQSFSLDTNWRCWDSRIAICKRVLQHAKIPWTYANDSERVVFIVF